jgi:hypothetical protein
MIADIRVIFDVQILCNMQFRNAVQNYNCTCFVWVQSLVCHIKVRTEIEGVWEEFAEENIWT